MKHEYQTCHTDILAEEDDSLFPTGSYLIKQVQYVCNNWEYFTHLFQLMSIAIWLIIKLFMNEKKTVLTTAVTCRNFNRIFASF
jgi:hypothetical protein